MQIWFYHLVLPLGIARFERPQLSRNHRPVWLLLLVNNYNSREIRMFPTVVLPVPKSWLPRCGSRRVQHLDLESHPWTGATADPLSCLLSVGLGCAGKGRDSCFWHISSEDLRGSAPGVSQFCVYVQESFQETHLRDCSFSPGDALVST